MTKLTVVTAAFGLVATAGMAQTVSRRASFTGSGNPNEGKCTIEVVVDASAEITVRGDTATLRNTGGRNPEWRRFECTAPMPANPANFRFAGVDGRGRQSLVGDPRNNNGAAVIRIEDNEGGAEAYTFDIFWNQGNGPLSQERPNGRFEDRGDRPFQGGEGPSFDRGEYRGESRFTEDQAVRVCQDRIRDEAANRFRTPDVEIRRITLDNNQGRRDWVTGELLVHRRFGRGDVYRFSCSVDFQTGRVRTAQIDQFERGMYPR